MIKTSPILLLTSLKLVSLIINFSYGKFRLRPLVTWQMHAWSGSGGRLILLVWSGIFCLLCWLFRWPCLPWMLTKWLNYMSQPSLLRWAHPSRWWFLASTNTDILGLMLNACVKDAALLRSDGELRPGRISGLLLVLTLDFYIPSVDTTTPSA